MDNYETSQDDPDTLIYDITNQREIENISIDYRNANFKFVKINLNDIKNIHDDFQRQYITLVQDFKLGKGGIFWDGSFVLTKILYQKIFQQQENISSSKKWILELGAGTALPSIVALTLGHAVVTTDIPKLIPFIESNFTYNQHLFHRDHFSSVQTLTWQNLSDIEAIQRIQNEFDIIIGSEIIYLDEYFDDLIKVLKTFSTSRTQILLSYKIRLIEMVEDFLSRVIEDFEVSYIDDALVKETYPQPEKLKIIILKLKKRI